ncbi:MAG TPA: protein kinase [Vicinamibacterales bacterium]|nr:protein kinase [Vicinamibacterales bacterium]
MSLGPGTRLGPYEIVCAIGAGGMGEVYRATDTNLGREVAIKVLPDAFAQDPERVARFEREAKTLASLNHPNIAIIHGLEKSQGTYALVMELVEGEDLSQRIARGAIPIDEALPIAKQIAEALEAAHEQGIIHRDLKPANIKVRPDGTVKVLDFGLAKLIESSASSISDASMSPTITSPALMSGVGMLLGTAAYMSPEQAKGRPADKRSDLWAFGCVLYEMLTGKRAFPGDDVSETLAGVIKSEPEWSAVPDDTRSSIRRLLRRCLQKDPRRRLHDAGDARIELEEPPDAPPQIVPAPSRPRRSLPWLIAFVSLVVAAISAGALFYYSPGETAAPIRFFVTAPDGWELARLSAPPSTASPNPLTISPDGRTLAFVARSMDGRFQIWLRSLTTLTARPLDGTEGAASPFWSPDSSALGFFAGGKLKKIGLSGGPPFTLADAPNERGGTWSREGVIVFAPTATSPLMKVPAAGGTAIAVTSLGSDLGHRRPVFLPDGRHLLYHGAATSSQDKQRIYLGSIDSPEHTPLITSDSGNVVYTRGYLLFIRETALLAQPFDVNRLMLTGDPFPVAEQVQIAGNPPVGVFSASETGILAYQAGTRGTETELVWFDRAGKKLGTLGTPGPYLDVELSSDAKQAAINLPDQTSRGRDIWLFDVARNLRTRFTFNAADELTAIWSPDRSRVVFSSRRNGKLDLYVKAASGAGTEELLFEDQFDKIPTSWSADGQYLLYVSFRGATTGNDLYVLPLSGERKPIPFATMPFSEAPGAFSPDGRWIAYSSNESGTNELYVAPFPARGGKWQVSNGSAGAFRWSRNGAEIVYLAPDSTLMAVDVNGKGTAFEVGTVKPLFRTRVAPVRSEWAVTPDGQRFLINTLPEQTVSPLITVVVNWTAELKH